MTTINPSEFTAHCLAPLDHVNSTREPITILKRGRPVAQLTPPRLPDEGVPQDALRGSVQEWGDIESPVLPPSAWEAESGPPLKALLDTHILVRPARLDLDNGFGKLT